MATTAQSFIGFEAPGADDAMEIHSDNEYEMGDDGLDLDVDLVDGTQQPEDDVLSLQDAGADGEVDAHATSGDHDDLMIDKEDLIEEDEIDFGDLDFDDVGQPTLPNATESPIPHGDLSAKKPEGSTPQEHVLEEDFIDFSDDEDEEPQVATPIETRQPLANEPVREDEGVDYSGDGENHTAAEECEVGNAESHYQPEGTTYHENSQSKWDDEDIEDPSNLDQHLAPTDDEFHGTGKADMSSADALDETATDGEKPTQEESNDESHQSNVKDDHDVHSITINYDGTEYWLFKHHDNQDGDWLLDDPSLATKPIYDLFSACRTQLADDLNGDTELGIRFDNFRALTIYEDSTACAVTTIQDLVDIYLNLHAQDGNADPESFYVSLQFRPRVVSLIGELKKAVQKQIGFSGWNDLIVAGQTIFTTSYTDEYTEQWEGEGPNTEGQDPVEQVGEDHYSEEHEVNIHHEDTESNESPADASASSNPTPAIDESDKKNSPQSHNEEASDADSYEEHEGEIVEDIIDYSSDEEGPTEHALTREQSAGGVTSSSSTVDGQNAAAGEDDTNHDSLEKSRVSDNDEDESLEGENDEDELTQEANADADTYAQYDEGAGANANDDDEYPYDDLEREYGQNYSLENTAPTYGGNEYSTEGLDQGGDGYYYEDDNTAFYEQEGFGLATGTDNQGQHGEQDNAAELEADYNLAGVDDFLDLTGEAEDTSPHVYTPLAGNNEPQNGDNVDNQGKELHAYVAESTTASPVIALSIGLEDLGSSQGLKRPIEQVDIGYVDSSDLTDVKRQKL